MWFSYLQDLGGASWGIFRGGQSRDIFRGGPVKKITLYFSSLSTISETWRDKSDKIWTRELVEAEIPDVKANNPGNKHTYDIIPRQVPRLTYFQKQAKRETCLHQLDQHILQNFTLNREWSVCTCFRFGHQRPLFALERHRSRGKCPNLPVLLKSSKFPSWPPVPCAPSGPLKHCLSALNMPSHQSQLKQQQPYNPISSCINTTLHWRTGVPSVLIWWSKLKDIS